MFRSTLVVLVFVAFAAGEARASASVEVSLNAPVMPVCRFFTAAPVLNIRNVGTRRCNIDPGSAVTGPGSAANRYRGTKQTMPTFTVPATVTLTCGGCPGTATMPAVITSTNNGAGRGVAAGADATAR